MKFFSKRDGNNLFFFFLKKENIPTKENSKISPKVKNGPTNNSRERNGKNGDDTITSDLHWGIFVGGFVFYMMRWEIFLKPPSPGLDFVGRRWYGGFCKQAATYTTTEMFPKDEIHFFSALAISKDRKPKFLQPP